MWVPDRAFATMVVDECSAFPHGEHDDLVDTVSQDFLHLRNSGVILRACCRLRSAYAGRRWPGQTEPTVGRCVTQSQRWTLVQLDFEAQVCTECTELGLHG